MNDGIEHRTHRRAIVSRPQDHPGQVGRFGNITRMVIHPNETDPTAPNTGTITYPPGTGFPRHRHDFAQVWYVIEGECQFGADTLRPGDMVYMQDPHFEYDMHTEKGCKILFVQYQGPTTGQAPIYAGRFDHKEKPDVEAQDHWR